MDNLTRNWKKGFISKPFFGIMFKDNQNIETYKGKNVRKEI